MTDKPDFEQYAREVVPEIGKYGVCSIGFIGKITDRKDIGWGMTWVGVNPFNDKPWSSRNPIILNEEATAQLVEVLY